MNRKEVEKRFRGRALAVVVGCIVPGILVAASVELRPSKNQIDVIIEGKPFTTYYFSPNVAKAYLMPLRTPSGVVISRGFPVENDVSHADTKAPSFEPHQRPLYFAHGDIDGLDFWGEAVFQKYYGEHSKQAYGHMASTRSAEIRDGTIRADFALEDPYGRVIAAETQIFTFRGDDRTRTIDCEFRINATHGPVTIGDTKEGTFGIRLGSDLSTPLVQMINSQGGKGEQEIWGKRANWVDYSGTASGRKVGIVVFDHPKSFRHPTTWHARAYGLLAANPFALREFTKDPKNDGSYTLSEGNSLGFRYRVVIYEGELEPSRLTELYDRYALEP